MSEIFFCVPHLFLGGALGNSKCTFPLKQNVVRTTTFLCQLEGAIESPRVW